MKGISESVRKRDHGAKMRGQSIYVGDYPGEGVLCGKILRSPWPRARIRGVRPPDLPDGYFYVDASDVPGDNNVNIVQDDTPVFCRETVEYRGEPIALVCGPDAAVVDEILRNCAIEHEELAPELDVRTASKVFFDYEFGHGDLDAAFASADRVFEEEFSTGYQDQAYLETQAMMAEPDKGGGMFVHGSLQCLYYVHRAVTRVLGYKPEDVRIAQDVTGGAFGGKEAFPSILGAQVAVAAHKAKKPVRCVFGRREDLEFSSKRHPSLCKYRAAVKNGKIVALDCDIIFNAGAYTTLSPVVLQRGIIAAPGVYNIPNIHVRGRAVRTNTPPCGAFRGFGAPQTFFAVEMLFEHIARALGQDALAFRQAHLAKQGDLTSTQGRYHFPVPLPAMIERVDQLCGYRSKRAEYARPQTGRFRRGIGLSLVFHGAGFTGNGERDIIKAVARLRKHPDGSVEILAANGEIGQGLRTTFPKIVARELGLPLDRVSFGHPDTGRVPDSGPTVASRSIMVVGEILRRAAVRLRENWIDGDAQEVEEHFCEPDFVLPFSLETFTGDAYPTFSWAVSVLEVEIDTLTGTPRVLDACGVFDVGTPIDENIVLGQLEGGFLQGIGFACMERMDYNAKGIIRNNSLSDYLVPTSVDVPKLQCALHVETYPHGPFGAKGAGELPLVGAPGAYVAAIEQALGGVACKHLPFVAEDILRALDRNGMQEDR